MSSLLEGTGLVRHFGGVTAVDNVDLKVSEGEFVALVGPNGAGKSTLLGVIAGAIAPDSGRVTFSGHDVTEWPSWKRARHGLIRSFQANRVLASRTVDEHLRLAALAATGPTTARALRGMFSRSSYDRASIGQAARMFHLDGLLEQRADSLPFGHQRLLSMAIAVVASERRPTLLLLDEPLAGMNEDETAEALEVLSLLQTDGYTIVMVEHNMEAVAQASSHVVVLDMGRKILEGPVDEVMAHPDVIRAYLGTD
jgi:ABC-type branched-subunit amino acid transport system ATPase component